LILVARDFLASHTEPYSAVFSNPLKLSSLSRSVDDHLLMTRLTSAVLVTRFEFFIMLSSPILLRSIARTRIASVIES
jgi:hypothetical protein